MNSLDYQRIFHEIKNTITLINSSAQLLDSKYQTGNYISEKYGFANI